MRALVCSVFFLLTSHLVLAQPAQVSPYFEPYAHPQKSKFFTGLGVGFSAYDGTITRLTNTDKQNGFRNPQFSFDVGYQATNYIAIILRANYIRLNLENERRAGEVSSNNVEGTAIIRHYLFSQQQYDEYLRKFNYYGFAGIGALYINPKNRDTGEPYADNTDFDQLTMAVPIGAGVEYRLSNFFSMALEGSYHFTGSDFLDGEVGPNSNDRSGNDRFALLNVRIHYRIPRKAYNYDELLKLKN